MKPEDKVKIAVAGHTNTGKTTLIRTLMRTSVGEVGDYPNVTKKGEAYYYDALQATFIDTPGFQHALAVSIYFAQKEENPDFKIPKVLADKISYDMDAVASLESSDIVLYVGSLNVVPDDGYKEEINIIKKIQPRVVAILNKQREQIQAAGKETTDKRIAQWQDVFEEFGIEFVIIFDAYWDKPSIINQIYDGVYKSLPSESQEIFREGLAQFKRRQIEIRQEAFDMLAYCIERCQRQSRIFVKKGNYSESEAKQKIAAELYEANLVFLTRAARLYRIAAEHPTESKDQLRIRLTETVDFGARVKAGAFASTVAGGAFAAIGAAVGAAITGVLSGGLGAGAGAVLGAQIGGGIGAALGGIGLFVDQEDNVEVGVDSREIRNIAASNLAALWGLSNVGFGRGRELAQGEIEGIKNAIINSSLLPSNVDWTRLSKKEMVNYCNKIFDALETS